MVFRVVSFPRMAFQAVYFRTRAVDAQHTTPAAKPANCAAIHRIAWVSGYVDGSDRSESVL